MNTVDIKLAIKSRKRQIKHLENARKMRKQDLNRLNKRYKRKEITYDIWLDERIRLVNSITNLDKRIIEIQTLIENYENLAA